MLRRGHRTRLLLAASALTCSTAADAGETITYSYDSLGRLVRVERAGTVNNGINAQYSYDPADNRTNVTVSTAASPSVAGGGFEAPDLGASYLYRPTASFTNNSGIAGNGSAWGFAAAPEGDQVAFIQTIAAPAVISLGVSGLAVGASYRATFHLVMRPGFPANPVTVAFNGTALGTFTPGSTSFTAVTSPAFTATAATGTLTFTGSAYSGDSSTGLDNVTVAAVGTN